jgi:hypothetical protein
MNSVTASPLVAVTADGVAHFAAFSGGFASLIWEGYDVAGNLAWSQRVASPEPARKANARPHSLAVAPRTSVAYVAGDFRGIAAFGPASLTSIAGDGFVAKWAPR